MGLSPEDLEKLKQAYKEMADLTNPVCANECKVPLSCCSSEYCEFTVEYAKKEYGITLEPTGHPELPMMGEKGCTVEPYLRPLCTVHTCQVGQFGGGKTVEWSRKYWEIRERIEELEYERRGGYA